MKGSNAYVVLAAIGALSCAAAYATDRDRPHDMAASKAIYRGLDAQGNVVQLTIGNVDVQRFERVSSDGKQYPELHWTAFIGTGTGTEHQR